MALAYTARTGIDAVLRQHDSTNTTIPTQERCSVRRLLAVKYTLMARSPIAGLVRWDNNHEYGAAAYACI